MKFMIAFTVALFATSFADAAPRCVTDRWGDIYCTKSINGTAQFDRWGKPVCGAGDCMTDKWGDIRCSQFDGGGIMKDKWGELMTGPGQCMTDRWGNIKCARMVGGAIAKDKWGDIVCQGGCQDAVVAGKASEQFCDRLN